MRKVIFSMLAVAALIHIMGVAILLSSPAHSEELPTAEATPAWRAFDHQTVDPQWEKFKKDHRGYKFVETEIYRGTQRSVNRFYLED